AAPLVSTRDFSLGFQMRDGSTLTYPSGFGSLTGQTVEEFWGLRLRSAIDLAGMPEGDYQFAAIVDDGFRMTVEGHSEPLINLDGVNASTLVVSDRTVRITAGSRLPV